MRKRRFDEVKKRKHVGAKSLLQLFGGNLEDTVLGMLLRGIVDDDIEMLKAFDRLCHNLLARCFFSYISSDQQTFTPFFFNQPFSLFCVVMFIEIDNCNVSPFLCHSNCGCSADAAITTGD